MKKESLGPAGSPNCTFSNFPSAEKLPGELGRRPGEDALRWGGGSGILTPFPWSPLFFLGGCVCGEEVRECLTLPPYLLPSLILGLETPGANLVNFFGKLRSTDDDAFSIIIQVGIVLKVFFGFVFWFFGNFLDEERKACEGEIENKKIHLPFGVKAPCFYFVVFSF